MITIEQLKSIKERTEALYRYLDIEGKKIQVEEEQLRTQAPGFWDDQKTAEAQMKKVKGLQQWIAGYNEIKTLSDELQLAFDFYKDELVTEEEIDEAYAKVTACPASRHNPTRHGRNGKVAHDADNHKDDIYRIASVRYEIRV